MYKSPEQRYKKVNGKQVIEIRVKEALQLFDSRDPAPFRDRDLDDDFTEYIIASADEFSIRTPLAIQIYISQKNNDVTPDSIIEAIHSYFEYQIELKRNQFTKIMRMAQLFLFVGLVFLFICLGISKWISSLDSEILSTTLREGIVIFGWVSMWKPLELILFDWYPIYDRIRLFRKLLKTEIKIMFEAKSVP